METILAQAGGDASAFSMRLSSTPASRSCPKLARRTLGLGLDHPTSVTGGLSFFGGPLNNYMSHAACAMVREVRAGAKLGLIYGQGEFVTKLRWKASA